MNRKEKFAFVVVIALLLIAGGLFASGVSWVMMGVMPDCTCKEDITHESLYLNEGDAHRAALSYNPDREYFWRYTVKRTKVRGYFPIVTTKVDTMGKPVLMSIPRRYN